jgi:hypothetical protein
LDSLTKQINPVQWEGMYFIGNDSVSLFHASTASNNNYYLGRSSFVMYTMKASENQLLIQLFNDPKKGFVVADKLFRRAKRSSHKITKKPVNEFLSQNPITQVFQKPKNAKLTPKIHGKVGHYQADLTFLTRYQ